MIHILTTLFRGETALIKNLGHNLSEHMKMLSVRSFSRARITFPCHVVCTNHSEVRHNQNKLCGDFLRTVAHDSNRNDNNSGTRTIVIPKSINRWARKRKIRDALEERQRKIQKGVENVFEDKRVALTNTRKIIQERGKLIMQDIKVTKDKMKEKIEEVIERENVYTIPNFLCITRIVLSPLLGYFIVSHKFEYALTLMIVAGISDWVDGWIARNYESQSSKIGSFLDPMADKVLIGTLFLSLTYINLIPFPLTALIIGRDIILITSGFVIRYNSLPPPRTLSRYFDVTHATAQLAPTFISKVNTGIQLILVATTLAAPVFGYVNHEYLQVLWYVTATSTVVAASSYIFSKKTYKYLKTKQSTRNIKGK